MLDFIAQFPKEAWGAAGVVVGALLALLGVRLSSQVQERIAVWQIEKDVRIHREKLDADLLTARAGRMIQKLEESHEALSEVAMAFSITGMYFTREDQPVEEFRAWYLSYCRKVERIIGTVSFYVPNGADSIRKLYGQMNIYWGEMEGIIIAHAEGKNNVKQSRRDKAFKASREISELAASVARSLEYTAQETLKPFGRLRQFD